MLTRAFILLAIFIYFYIATLIMHKRLEEHDKKSYTYFKPNDPVNWILAVAITLLGTLIISMIIVGCASFILDGWS